MSDFLPPLVATLLADTKEYTAKLHEAGVQAEELKAKGSSSFSRLATFGKAALLGLGAVAIGVGAESLHLADTWETSHAKMVTAVKNTGSSMQVWQGQIGATEHHLEALGYTNAQVDESLAVLVTSTGNVKKALDLQGTAADLARFKHIGLSDASFMLSRALQGNSRVLKQLGIDLPVNAKGAESLKVAQHNLVIQEQTYQNLLDKSHAKKKLSATDIRALQIAHEKLTFAQRQVTSAEHAHTLILDALNQKIHGQATAYAETFAGKLAVLKARSEDWGKNLGVWLIPKIETLVTWLSVATGWLQKHKTEATVLAAVIGGTLAVAIGAYLVTALTNASKALTLTGRAAQLFGVQAAEGETAAELPLLPWIAAIAAVGIAAYELYKHWSTVWGGIKRATSAVWDFLKTYGVWIVGAFLGPIGLAAVALYKNWSTVWGAIRDVALAAWHFLDNDVLHPIVHGFEVVAGGIESAGGKVFGFLRTWGPVALTVLVPFIGIPLLIAQHFDAIEGFLAKAWDRGYAAVKTGVGAVVGFMKGLPRMILSALGDLSQLLYQAGLDVISGFVHGIEHAAGGVKDALGSITHKLTSWKGPPAKDRSILTPAGQMVIQGFIDGIESMTAKVRASLGKFTVHAHDLAFGGGKAVADALIKGLDTVDARLKTKLASVTSQLDALKASAKQMADSIGGSLSGAAGLANNPDRTVDQAQTNPDGTPTLDAAGNPVTQQVNIGPDTSTQGVTSYLASSLAALQQFQGDLSTLAGKGLSPDQLQQIAQMGVTQGDKYAQSFLGASADQIAQLNSLDSQIQKVSSGIGTLVSDATFGAGIAALTATQKQEATAVAAIGKDIAQLAAEAKAGKKKHGDIHVHLDGNLYGVSAKEFAKEVRDALLVYRRTSGQTLGFT